jgi:hypothetical protein
MAATISRRANASVARHWPVVGRSLHKPPQGADSGPSALTGLRAITLTTIQAKRAAPTTVAGPQPIDEPIADGQETRAD